MLTKNSLANEKNLKTTDEDFYTNILQNIISNPYFQKSWFLEQTSLDCGKHCKR